MEFLSTYGEREVENVITLIKKPAYTYETKVNNITILSISVDFISPLDLLGINLGMLKLPALPKLPDLSIPTLGSVIVGAMPSLPSIDDLIAIPTPPVIEIEVSI
jgi:hypothetical protein